MYNGQFCWAAAIMLITFVIGASIVREWSFARLCRLRIEPDWKGYVQVEFYEGRVGGKWREEKVLGERSIIMCTLYIWKFDKVNLWYDREQV